MFLDPPSCVHRDKFKVRRSACVAKDSPRITDGELQRLVESKWQKDKKIQKFKQPLHHHMLFGRVSRNILLVHPKTNSSISSCQTWLLISNATGFYGQMKLKKKLFSSKPTRWVGANPMLKLNILADLNVEGLFFCRRSWTSCSETSWILSHTNRWKIETWLPMLEIL